MKRFNLEEYLKNPSRKVVTKSGINARIICVDRKNNEYPVIALVEETLNGDEYIQCYTKEGHYYTSHQSGDDLFFAPEKHERWINLYKDDDIVYASMDTFKTKEEAEAASCSTCIATAKIEWEE